MPLPRASSQRLMHLRLVLSPQHMPMVPNHSQRRAHPCQVDMANFNASFPQTNTATARLIGQGSMKPMVEEHTLCPPQVPAALSMG